MGATKLAVAKDDSVGKQAANDLLRKQVFLTESNRE